MIKNRYLLLLLFEIFDRLSGIKVYIKLDIRDIYYCIAVAEDDI